MSYYDTIDDDVKRAKEILAKGRADSEALTGFGITPDNLPTLVGGTIYGGDVYAAYKLLESFVEEIERLRAEIATTDRALSREQERRALGHD